MFGSLRRCADALQTLQGTLDDMRLILTAQAENTLDGTALSDRVAAIEIGYAKESAEAQALVLKADALFKNARNAEERTRDMNRKADEATEGGIEGEREIREAYARLFGLPPGDVNGIEEVGVPALPASVGDLTGRDPAKTRRLRAKFR